LDESLALPGAALQVLDRYTLSEEQKAFWAQNGFLVLRGAISSDEADEILSAVNLQWANREGNDHVVDILSGELAGKDFRMCDIDPALRSAVYKLNSLFARVPKVREVCHSAVVRSALQELLGGDPIICASLNFERGSQQPYHFDTWYMPPPVDNMMIAASFALEDVDAENGPLTYYPGSHLMPPFRFSNGGLIMIDEEAPTCSLHVSNELQGRGLAPENFRGGKGDVFLWHAQLLHGGSAIQDLARTRNSMVVHYWREQDVPAEQVRKDQHGAYLGRSLRGEIAFENQGDPAAVVGI
jgi:ectoine hydroxylase-related dioxygenase (phytanoyl-CoA dioxygenase family)